MHVLACDLAVERDRKEQCDHVDEHGDRDRDQECEQVRVPHALIAEQREVVVEPDPLVTAVALRVGERIHDAADERHVQEHGEDHRGRHGHPAAGTAIQ